MIFWLFCHKENQELQTAWLASIRVSKRKQISCRFSNTFFWKVYFNKTLYGRIGWGHINDSTSLTSNWRVRKEMFDNCDFSSRLLYLFTVNNRDTIRCETCSMLTTKTPERYWYGSGVFIVNFEHNSPFSNVSTIDFEQVYC